MSNGKRHKCRECGRFFRWTEEDVVRKSWGVYVVCPKCGFNNYSINELEELKEGGYLDE